MNLHLSCTRLPFHTIFVSRLTDYDNRPFIHALDPKPNPSNLVACLNIEGLAICVEPLSLFSVERLIGVAGNRASRGANHRRIAFIDLGGFALGKDVLKLGECDGRVDCRAGRVLPTWDVLGVGWW